MHDPVKLDRALAYANNKRGFRNLPYQLGGIERVGAKEKPMKAREALPILKHHLSGLQEALSRIAEAQDDELGYHETRGEANQVSKAIRGLENPKAKGEGRSKRKPPAGMSKKELNKRAQGARKSPSKMQDSIEDFLANRGTKANPDLPFFGKKGQGKKVDQHHVPDFEYDDSGPGY